MRSQFKPHGKETCRDFLTDESSSADFSCSDELPLILSFLTLDSEKEILCKPGICRTVSSKINKQMKPEIFNGYVIQVYAHVAKILLM